MSIFLIAFGLVFMIVGIAIASIMVSHEEWRGWDLYKVYEHPYADVGLAFTIFGVITMIAGAIFYGYYEHLKEKLMKEKGLK